MRYLFVNRRTPAGEVTMEVENTAGGSFEIVDQKYFVKMSSIKEQIESKLGDLRMSDASLTVYDFDRKFRDTVLHWRDVNDIFKFKAVLANGVPFYYGQSLFYGYVDVESPTENEKSNIVTFTASSPLRLLAGYSIHDLYEWITSHRLEVDSDAEWAGGYAFRGKFVSIKTILTGMATLVGLAGVEFETSWNFFEWRNQYSFGVDRLYACTRGVPDNGGVVRSMFDSDTDLSPMSFYRFGNCLALLKYLQLLLFSFAYVRYNPLTDRATMRFKQRGSTTESFSMVAPRLLEQNVRYKLARGVKIENEYSVQPKDAYNYARATTVGSYDDRTGMALQLPWKSSEFQTSFTDYDYAYIFGAIDQVQDRPEIQMVHDVVANGWPLHGQRFERIHAALANAYYSAEGGRQQLIERKFHGILASKGPGLSVEFIRVMESESFVRNGEVAILEVTETEIDPFMNTCRMIGQLR